MKSRSFFFLLALTLSLLGMVWPLRAQTGSEGYYKDVFMDSGIRLTSKSDLPVTRYLDLTMERFISAVTKELTAVDTVLQYATFAGSPIDENGVLLYPDGALSRTPSPGNSTFRCSARPQSLPWKRSTATAIRAVRMS